MIDRSKLKWAALAAIAAFFLLKPGIVHDNAFLRLVGYLFVALTLSVIIASFFKD